MTCLQLLLGFCSLTVTSSIQVDGFSCVSAYWDKVSCVLNITDDPMGQSNTTYSLEFTYLDDTNQPNLASRTLCPIVLMNGSYTCVCRVTSRTLRTHDIYTIRLCHGSSCQILAESFQPSENIQLTPPYDVEVEKSPDMFNISWKSGYEDHKYLSKVLDYELFLQTEKKILPIGSQKSESIQRSQLTANAVQCFKVRSIPNMEDDYEATWSEWSPSTCLKNEAAEQENTLVTVVTSLGPVCVAFGLLLFVLSSRTARMKIKNLSHTPSPAPFFKPLYIQHEGNIQEWLSPKGKLLLTCKPEEILTTDAVMVVPKLIMKDPEENQELHSPPVTQLLITQCQTSYVGLPGIHEAPQPVTLACPRETSYTRLPCSVWGVDVREVEVVPTAMEGVLDISQADSGCSSEDMSESPDFSLPNSPVDDGGPPPCFCSDYCILNKTATGFAPVLVSKESNLHAPLD